MSRYRRRDNRTSLLASVAFCLVIAVMLLGQWRPLLLIDEAPEPWILVLSEAAAGRYRFGTDIVFTGGPLADLYTRLFNPETYGTTVGVAYGLMATQVMALSLLFARSRRRFFALLLFATLWFMVASDTRLMLTPLLFALLDLERPAGRGAAILILVGAVATACTTLIKFSIFPLALGLFVLADINRLRARALPIATIAYIVFFYLGFLLLAPGGDFVAYFTGSLQTSMGYAAAMSIAGPWLDGALFAAATVVSLVLLLAVERDSSHDRAAWPRMLSLLGLAFFLWISFKVGFTRHDLHVLTAFSSLALGLTVYGLSIPPPSRLSRPVAAVTAAIVLGAALYQHVVLATDPAGRFPLQTTLLRQFSEPATEIMASANALSAPGSWLAARQRAHEEAVAAMATASPIKELAGSIDIIPSNQSLAIAAGLDYRPRPTIQEYTTYTRRLIERNRAHYSGASAPDHVLFSTATIDERYPALTEAALWPILLARYAPASFVGDDLLLDRRAAAIDDLLGPPEQVRGRFGEPLPLVPGDDPLFVSIDLRPTILGRIVEFLFKPPFLYLDVTPLGGVETRYRLIPAIAREGFVASPLVRSSKDFALLAAGTRTREIGPIASLRVVGASGSRLAYDPEFTLTIRRVDRARLVAHRTWALPADQATTFDRDRRVRLMTSIVEDAGGPRGEFMVDREGLFAHAPRRFPVDVAGAGRLRVSVGMRAGSWDDGAATNGVCFRVLDGAGASSLWERCLAPTTNEADRVEQQAVVDLPRGTSTVMLETDCRGDCRWDWSYWGEIAAER